MYVDVDGLWPCMVTSRVNDGNILDHFEPTEDLHSRVSGRYASSYYEQRYLDHRPWTLILTKESAHFDHAVIEDFELQGVDFVVDPPSPETVMSIEGVVLLNQGSGLSPEDIVTYDFTVQ